MKRTLLLAGLVANLVAARALADPIATVVASHIEGNVPSAEKFAEFLRRDLQAYFTDSAGEPRKLEFEMLRDGPTQSGVSYPKYYVWVKVVDSAGNVHEGAVRVAAIEKVRFEVTHFVSVEQIRNSPDALQEVFPRPVCNTAIAKAGLRL